MHLRERHHRGQTLLHAGRTYPAFALTATEGRQVGGGTTTGHLAVGAEGSRPVHVIVRTGATAVDDFLQQVWIVQCQLYFVSCHLLIEERAKTFARALIEMPLPLIPLCVRKDTDTMSLSHVCLPLSVINCTVCVMADTATASQIIAPFSFVAVTVSVVAYT